MFMDNKTIQVTIENDLCCGCGLCKGICPGDCISWERKNGVYLPKIQGEKCINCGLCAAVCPGLGHSYGPGTTALEPVTGTVLACFNAWSKQEKIRHVSASGGVVTTLVRELLSRGLYDGVFCLDSYDYRDQLKTRRVDAREPDNLGETSSAPKSRYLPVSQENAVAYMKKHRGEKLIFIGTSCAVRGLRAAVKTLKLPPEQYLFIGLFCDKVFNYNVLSYFQDTYAGGQPLKALHFKNKESGGWPGDMKFFPEEGEPFYVPLRERAAAKAYFAMERCLYCVDKLNVQADISLGDNYTALHSSPLGSNSVILRTQTGAEAWEAVRELLEMHPVDLEEIQKAQALNLRLDQMYYGDLFCREKGADLDLNSGVPRERDAARYARAYGRERRKLKAGAVYDTKPKAVRRQIRADKRQNHPLNRFAARAAGFVKRRIKRHFP